MPDHTKTEPSPPKEIYVIYRAWGNRPWKSVGSEKEAWAAIYALPFGEGYEVRDQLGNIRSEFVPF